MNKHKRTLLICLYLVSMASIVSHAHNENIASLIQQFEHADVDVRDSASKALAEIGEAAVPALIAALDHENTGVQGRALSTLHRMRDQFHQLLVKDRSTPYYKHIVRGLVKALKAEDSDLRYAAIVGFIGYTGREVLTPEEITGFIRLFYYGSPIFSPDTSHILLPRMGHHGRSALIEALDSSNWALSFGTAIAYGNAFTKIHARRGMLLHHYIKPLPKAVVPILAEGLTHPDWRTQEYAASVLTDLDLRHCHICEHTDEARQALEALPPFGIISQTIKDRQRFRDPDALDSLNTDGITFKFNRSIYYDGEITISSDDGEPLGWNVEWSSHSVTITPPEGKELVKGRNYAIQLRDVRDVLRNQVDAEIEFSTIRSNRIKRPNTQ